MMINHQPVLWYLGKQDAVSLSITEAEYRAASEGVKDIRGRREWFGGSNRSWDSWETLASKRWARMEDTGRVDDRSLHRKLKPPLTLTQRKHNPNVNSALSVVSRVHADNLSSTGLDIFCANDDQRAESNSLSQTDSWCEATRCWL